MEPEAEGLVRELSLIPHPEGGYYRETWRSEIMIPGPVPGKVRSASTSILFLVPSGNMSRIHRLASDETWHFNLGGPLSIIELVPGKPPRRTVLGPNPAKGHVLQYTVKAGTWFGALPEPETTYSLVGCTVSPGFEFEDFTLGNRHELLQLFPEARKYLELFRFES